MTLRSQCRRTAAGIVLAAAALMLTTQDSMADWTFDPVLRAAWDFDDNATLSVRTDQEEEISGLIGEASIDLRNDSENGFLSLRPMFRTRNYNSDIDRDSDDHFVNFRSSLNGVRHDFRFFADYARESVRTAELADADLDTDIEPDDIEDDDTGNVGSRERRERLRITPRWSYSLSDRSALEADIAYLTVDYDDQDLLSTLFDYTDTRLRLTYRRNFSERSSGIFSVSGRDYTTERLNADRTGYSVNFGLNRALSETVQFRAIVGVEQTDREDPSPSATEDDPSFVTDISLTRRLETIRLLAQYRQRVAPSGRGLSKRDEFNLRFSRDLNDRFTAGLGVRAYKISPVEGNVSGQDYIQLRGQLIWRLSQAFSLQTDFRHTVINRAILGEGADSNRITMWLTYQPNPAGRTRSAISR